MKLSKNGFLQIGIGIVVATFMSGCLSTYETRLEHVQDTSKETKDCVESCKDVKTQCDIANYRKTKECKDNAMTKANEIYVVEKDNYDKELKIYKEQKRVYDDNMAYHNKALQEQEKLLEQYIPLCEEDRKQCSKKTTVEYEIKKIHKNKPTLGTPPLTPKHYGDFETILQQQQELCMPSYECQKNYDTCFTKHCGGEVVEKKVCVSGCDRKWFFYNPFNGKTY